MNGFVATIGMFDGVHLGHQFVLRKVAEEAHRQNLCSMCITFNDSPKNEQILTPLNRKVELIQALGIERVMVLPFTEDLKRLTAREFMRQWLCEERVNVLLTGYDNRFGHNRAEGFEDYVRYGHELGISVKALPPLPSSHGVDVVSSSLIRQLISSGQVDQAARCLGYRYTLTGHVTHGEHVGTALGFPTANIVPDEPRQLIPAAGVYAVTSGELKGIMNIGTRPTFGIHQQTLEVHFLDYSEDLYDRQVSVDFVCRLREERHFDSPEALIEQLKTDAKQTEALL